MRCGHICMYISHTYVYTVPTTGDVVQTRNAFIFNPGSTSSLERFTHRADGVCEYDELYTGTFEFDAGTIAAGFQTRKGEPNVTYIAIRDDDRMLNFDLYTQVLLQFSVIPTYMLTSCRLCHIRILVMSLPNWMCS